MRCSGDKSACSTDGRRRRSHRSRLLRNQIRTIASEAQIVCRRPAGSQQFLPLSALYATTSNLKGLPPQPPLLYSSDNLPFWMGFLWADRWENMRPGSSQQARVGDPVKEKVIGCYKRSPFQGKENAFMNQISKGCTILYFLY